MNLQKRKVFINSREIGENGKKIFKLNKNAWKSVSKIPVRHVVWPWNI